jgi:hypothetical protein
MFRHPVHPSQTGVLNESWTAAIAPTVEGLPLLNHREHTMGKIMANHNNSPTDLSPMIAVLAMSFSSASVIGNALRLR